MSAEYSTSNLHLNHWVESDVPSMEDFNRDNAIVDAAVGGHIDNESMHISQEDRDAWSMPYAIVGYAGNGNKSQNIHLQVGFEPRMVIVIATNHTPGTIDIPNEIHYNYFGIITTQGGSIGLSLDGDVLTVVSHPTLIANYEMRSYNQLGRSYIAICFR